MSSPVSDKLDDLYLMSRYNAWMNRRLLDAAAGLSDAERKADRGAFFHSIHGILNHVLLADLLWMSRFGLVEFRASRLDEELYSDFDELRARREETDRRIIEWVDGLTHEDLQRPITFRTLSNPQEQTRVLGRLLVHFFNHQTHHRGQLSTLLDQAGVDYPPTDIMWMPEMTERR